MTHYNTVLSQMFKMIPSMSRKGNCHDNAVAESFFSHLNNELIYHRDFADRDQVRSAIFEFIEVFYNRQRLHQTLGYKTPIGNEMRDVAKRGVRKKGEYPRALFRWGTSLTAISAFDCGLNGSML